jgi:hypothetical protein
MACRVYRQTKKALSSTKGLDGLQLDEGAARGAGNAMSELHPDSIFMASGGTVVESQLTQAPISLPREDQVFKAQS